MVPTPKRSSRTPKKAMVSLPRVELESSDEDSRSPPRQEEDRNPGDGTGSTPGAGTNPGDVQQTGPQDQSTTQGSGTAVQTSSAE